MESCLNCYNSWMCETKRPNFYKKHFDIDNDIDEPCKDWEDESLNYDED